MHVKGVGMRLHVDQLVESTKQLYPPGPFPAFFVILKTVAILCVLWEWSGDVMTRLLKI